MCNRISISAELTIAIMLKAFHYKYVCEYYGGPSMVKLVRIALNASAFVR